MKKVAILFIALVLGLQGFASDRVPSVEETKIREQIVDLLKRPEIRIEEEVLNANIKFILNANNEIVVLTVDSNQEMVDNYVKSRLNYQKLNKTNSKLENKVYAFSLKILKK